MFFFYSGYKGIIEGTNILCVRDWDEEFVCSSTHYFLSSSPINGLLEDNLRWVWLVVDVEKEAYSHFVTIVYV